MKCFLCDKKGKIKQQNNRYICDKCFSKQFEKRIRKFSRINKIFKKNDKILVIGEVNKFLVEKIVKDLPLKLYFDEKDEKKVDKILLEWTIDDEANDFLMNLLQKKKRKRFFSKEIKFLVVMTNEDVKEFARINKLKFKAKKIDESVKKIIDPLHKEHPSAKYTLIKNIEMLNRLTKMRL